MSRFHCSHCAPILFYIYISTPTTSSAAFISTRCVCVWRLTAACFWCSAAAVLTFFEPLACISHLRGSACFVCFDYYGRPPVVISHFEGTFKMPALECMLRCTENTWASGEVSWEPSSVKTRGSLIWSCGGSRCPGCMRVHESRCLGLLCVCAHRSPKHTQAPACLSHTATASETYVLTL